MKELIRRIIMIVLSLAILASAFMPIFSITTKHGSLNETSTATKISGYQLVKYGLFYNQIDKDELIEKVAKETLESIKKNKDVEDGWYYNSYEIYKRVTDNNFKSFGEKIKVSAIIALAIYAVAILYVFACVLRIFLVRTLKGTTNTIAWLLLGGFVALTVFAFFIKQTANAGLIEHTYKLKNEFTIYITLAGFALTAIIESIFDRMIKD